MPMDRDFQRGYLPVDFAVQPFDSAWRLLVRSAQVFFANFGFLAAVTLPVVLPAKAALQFACYLADIPTSSTTAYLLVDLGDLLLDALVIPAAIFGLMHTFRTGMAPSVGRSLRWGRRQWAKALWNTFKADVTIMLYGALLVVPGLVAMVKLSLVDPIVAIEADKIAEVLQRSRNLTEGHGWRIFRVLLPLMLIGLVANVLLFNVFGGHTTSRPVIALLDSMLSLGGQWSTVVALLLYLGLVPTEKPAAAAKQKTAR
jgi:hypothetical protein